MQKLRLEDYLDIETFERRFGVNLDALVNAFKKNKSDDEISNLLGIPEWKLKQIRNEIQQSHYRARIIRRKENLNTYLNLYKNKS